MRSGRLFLCAVALAAGCRTAPHDAVGPETESPTALVPTRFSDALSHFSMGCMYERGRPPRLDAALKEYAAAIALDPSWLETYFRVAELQYRAGQTLDAIATMREAVRHGPESFDAWMRLGAFAQIGGKYELAGEACRHACDLKPDDGMVYARLAYIYMQQDRLADALAVLEKGKDAAADRNIVLDTYPLLAGIFRSRDDPASAARCYAVVAEARPADIDARKNLIRCHLDAGNRAEAVRALDDLAADKDHQPDDFETILADLYEAVGNPVRAAAYLETVCRERPEDMRLSMRLASVYLDQGEYQKALALLQSVAERLPKQPFLLTLMGEVYEKLGDHGRAADSYGQACELAGVSAGTFIRLALVQLREENNAAAVQTLEKATERFPDDLMPATLLGWLYHVTGSLDQALARFEEVEIRIEAAKRPAEEIHNMFYFWYGAACERAGQIDRAAELFRKSIRVFPDNIEAYNYLAYMWAEKGIQLDEAEAHVTRALEAEPDNGAYIDTLGWIYYKQRKYKQALRQIRRSLELLPDDPTITDHLGDILSALNQRGDALAAWEKSFRLDPENEAVVRKLESHGVDVQTLRKEARGTKQAP